VTVSVENFGQDPGQDHPGLGEGGSFIREIITQGRVLHEQSD
jgi:hypothetical protein